MKNVLKQSRLIILLWTLFKVLGVFQTQRWLRSIGIERSLDQIVASQSGVWLWGAMLILAFFYLFESRRWFSQFNKRTVLVHAMLLGGFILIVPITPSMAYMIWTPTDGTFFEIYQDSLSQMSKDATLIYIALLSVSFGSYTYKEKQKGELKNARMREDLTRVKLELMQRQIQPHFLFNALHSISSLMEEDVKDAQNALVNLSDLLRKSLETQETTFITLQEELSILDLYLSLQLIRFSDSVEVKWELDDRLAPMKVPAFILQPLVENSFKHAMEGDKLLIEIVTRQNDGQLQVCIRDNGAGFTKLIEGTGIRSVRSRLAMLYEDAHFEIESDAQGTSSLLIIPLKT